MGRITDVPGIEVGHAEDPKALTGCTVVLARSGMVCGVDVRGAAPGTRETDLLNPVNLIEEVHAVVLTGGSAFGLQAAGGVMDYLEQAGIGLDTGFAHVPIVPGAVLYDLAVGRADVRPDRQMGYRACQSASTETASGNVGAGCGATVGKVLGPDRAMKGGIGTASVSLSDGLIVGALVATNAFGDIVDPEDGRILAGARQTNGKLLNTETWMCERPKPADPARGVNTTIGVVATNAKLSKTRVTKVAQMAHDGLARSIRPSHTMMDGDTLFALAGGEVHASIDLVGTLAANVVAEAIVNGVQAAQGVPGIPAAHDLT